MVANSPSGGNCAGSGVTDGGHNIDDGTTCGFKGTDCATSTGSSFCNTDSGLDPAGLANNGGPTQTIALLVGRPAIDAGDNSTCTNAPVSGVDQRGVPSLQ
ncbi:MAG: choice-of-anchor Q domain-containing protein [Candidatus Binatia bacterium]